MEQEYKLENRHGDSIILTKIKDNTYKLSGDNGYTRFGLYNCGGYYFVDPSGGPFMMVGSFKIDNKVLSKIDEEDGDIILTFCDYNNLYDETAKELNKVITTVILKYAKEHLIDMNEINYRMSITDNSLDKVLVDTDTCLEILKNGERIGFNA